MLNGREVWRISGGDQYGIKKTRLFKLQGISAAMLTSIKVYDSFAVVNFGVDKILLAIRPEVEG